MGLQLFDAFPWLAAVCCGGADVAFPRLLGALLDGEPHDIPGVLLRQGGRPARASVPVTDLDALPLPEYGDFFAQLARSRQDEDAAHIVVETSRGCWWGVKHHCTFCGLNGDTM